MFHSSKKPPVQLTQNYLWNSKIVYGKPVNIWFQFENCDLWKAGKLTSPDGIVFYEAAFLANDAFYFMIYLFGSPDEAKEFSCTISVKTKNGEKFIYIGEVMEFHSEADEIQ